MCSYGFSNNSFKFITTDCITVLFGYNNSKSIKTKRVLFIDYFKKRTPHSYSGFK
jgi:hypothetical protein